jgi:hypothetical protein
MRSKTRTSVVTLVLATTLMAVPAAPASAQPAKPGTTAKPLSPEDEARARFYEGVALADAGDHEAARLKFSQAWALFKSPIVLYNLALAEQLSQHPVEALEHYRLFGKMTDPKITDVQRQWAAESIAALSKKVGQIEIEAPRGARVSVDGKPVEVGEDPIPVTPGKHVVEAIVDGKVRGVIIECGAGNMMRANLLDEPAPPSRAPPPAVTAPPPPEERAPEFWTTGRIIGAGVAGAGAVAVGLGVAFHVGAASSADEAAAIRAQFPPESRDHHCSSAPTDPRCGELRSAIDDERSLAALRTGSFVAGGTALLGGAVLFVLSSPRESRRGMVVLPVASRREAGLSLAGRF